MLNEEIKISELKTNIWRNVNKDKFVPEIDYDGDLDTLFFFFTVPGKDTIVTHYVDQNVALLFRATDREIVGISIEGFERSFASRYAKNPWQLSKTGCVLEGVKDFRFGVMREEETNVTLRTRSIRVERDIKLHPEFAFA